MSKTVPDSPMMKQYGAIKQEHPDCFLLFRLGDFYELFFDDAVEAAKELGLVLTQRQGAPMCGIPWHAHEMYLTKLVKNGHRVAICDQTETPAEAKLRGCKGPIDRKVVRIVSSGTIVEQSMLQEKNNNFLFAISNRSGDDLGIAYADVSTGRFYVEQINYNDILSAISKISPSEILCPDNLLSKKEFLECIDPYKSIIIAIPSAKFMNQSSSKRLAAFFNVSFIDAFGEFSECALEAASEIAEYVAEVYQNLKAGLSVPKLIRHSDYMYLDHFTRRSLEITVTQSGNKRGSLLSEIDETMTSQGARLLGRWLMQPLVNMGKIEKRLGFVEFFVARQDLLREVRHTLKHFPDIERALARILIGRAGPRDLKCIAVALEKAMALEQMISSFEYLKGLRLVFDQLMPVLDIINSAIVDEPPVLARDGGFIKKGYDHDLDEYMELMDNGEYIIQKMQKAYAEETGIQTLKIKNNGVIGYFIEISPAYVSKVPYTFIHRQTLGSCIRYTTRELGDIASKVYSAESNLKRREMEVFENITHRISCVKDTIRQVSDNISFIDVITSFAHLAIGNGYSRPAFTNDKRLIIRDGRHPVVENSLRNNGLKFVPNDCNLTDGHEISILTGPNMGGKSTYLRQNAIITIMAQIGSFVPATDAEIGIVDRIFCRVGASDDISTGKSTFMVEMLETATILRQAGEKSLIILDEIGRGTATYDGLAIAWAVIEELANNIRARTLFATHYHELGKLKEYIGNVGFLTVKVEDWNDRIVFLHRIEEGFADRSYGINVAALAGFPEKVILRAQEILKDQNTTS
ncbi:MAG: DNA mismatch repair protein MutS [Holosporales bacterium]|nr:DNA mismatch repair protein MutS [Holosporales bacterium]